MADSGTHLKYDSILCEIGGCGKYQILSILVLMGASVLAGVHACAIVFKVVDPPFRCSVPGLQNDTFHIQSEAHGLLVNASVPFDSDDGQYAQCNVYGGYSEGLVTTNSTFQCRSWVYDTDIHDTVVSSLDLVCDRASFKTHFNMVVLLALLLGSFTGGTLADFFGRKTVLAVGLVIQAGLGVGLAFTNTVMAYMLVQFAICFVNIANFLITFVFLSEIVGPTKRGLAGMMSMIGWGIGMYYLVIVDYLAKEWRLVQIILSVPGFLFIPMYWAMDESPRWLLVKNKVAEAEKVIRRIARVNGREAPEHLGALSLMNPDNEKTKSTNLKLWHLCSSKTLVIRIFVLAIGWTACAMVYYGLTLNVGTLIEGDVHVNFAIVATMETSAYCALALFLGTFDRKKLFCFSLMVAGVACLGSMGTVFSESNISWLSITLYSIGKFFITFAFSLVYIVTSELLPTEVRNSGLGFCSCIGRVAAVISPYVAMLGHTISESYGNVLPLAVFGVLSIIAALSTIVLPETRNQTLPECMDDAKGFKGNCKMEEIKA